MGEEKGAIPVSAARELGQKYPVMNVVIFAINHGAKTFTVTTWGKTKELCAWAAKIGDDIFDAVLQGFVCNGSAHEENPYEHLAALRAENGRLRDALEFYADKNNYDPDGAPGNEVNVGPDKVEWQIDGGCIASRALKEATDENE